MLKTLFGLSLAGPAPLFVAPSDDPMGQTGVLDEEAFAALHALRQGEAPELGERRAYLSLPSDEELIGALDDSGVVVAEAHDFLPFCRGLR